MRYIIMCKSLTYAQRASRALEGAGINSQIIKAPAGLSGNGCSYSVAVSDKNADKAVKHLRTVKLPFGKIYKQNNDGQIQEVLL